MILNDIEYYKIWDMSNLFTYLKDTTKIYIIIPIILTLIITTCTLIYDNIYLYRIFFILSFILLFCICFTLLFCVGATIIHTLSYNTLSYYEEKPNSLIHAIFSKFTILVGLLNIIMIFIVPYFGNICCYICSIESL